MSKTTRFKKPTEIAAHLAQPGPAGTRRPSQLSGPCETGPKLARVVTMATPFFYFYYMYIL
jgi:hypothetical protein